MARHQHWRRNRKTVLRKLPGCRLDRARTCSRTLKEHCYPAWTWTLHHRSPHTEVGILQAGPGGNTRRPPRSPSPGGSPQPRPGLQGTESGEPSPPPGRTESVPPATASSSTLSSRLFTSSPAPPGSLILHVGGHYRRSRLFLP